MKFSKTKYLETHSLIQKKIELNDINIDKLFDIQHTTSFHQELKGGRMKDEARQLIQ